jgi:aryl-alcohol dehydrogenase-like predicted oxidoreductase
MGTWQFNGQFKQLSEEEIIRLLNFAKKNGIKKFDTALVYGPAEKCISKIIDNETFVLTKIPAKRKPSLEEDENITEYYTKEYINECINKSLTNLQRDYIDTILLHNWNQHWDKYEVVISWLIELKNKGIVKKIGISLPNNYSKRLSKEILYNIDVIEAPYNKENKWIEKDIDFYKQHNIEIILRSLFLQGKLLSKNNYIKYIEKANTFNTSLVIGMTTEKQITNNINSQELKNTIWAEFYERMKDLFLSQSVLFSAEKVVEKGDEQLKVVIEHLLRDTLSTIEHMDAKGKYIDSPDLLKKANELDNIIITCKSCNKTKRNNSMRLWKATHPEIIKHFKN